MIMLGKKRGGRRLNLNYRRTFHVLAVATTVLLINAGCMVGPDYAKPEAAVESQWLNQSDSRIKQSEAKIGDWWKVFKDPDLDRLVEEARRQNLNLQLAGVRILEARAQLGIATGNEYPQLQQLNGDLGFQQISQHAPNTSSFIDRNFGSVGIGLDAGWELDIWGKFRRGVEASLANQDASVAGYDDALVSLTAEVVRTYVLLRTNEAQIQVARDNVKIQQRTLEIADALFSGGLITELDYLQAKSLLSRTLAVIPPLQASVRQSKNALGVLLGKSPGSIDGYVAQARSIPVAPAEIAVGVPADLLRRRPDIRLAERQLAKQSSLIGVAKADLYPHFSLLGSINLRASDAALTFASGGASELGDLFNAKSFQYFIGPSLSWDIFNYGRITNQVRVEDARFQQLIADYRSVVLNAAKEAEDATIAFLKSQEQRDELQQTYEASKRSTDLSLYQYQEGLVDYQRVLDSQRNLVVSQESLVRVSGDIATNLIALYKALGGGWETRTESDFVDKPIQKQMNDRTDWGDLLEPGELDLPEEDKNDWWRLPDW